MKKILIICVLIIIVLIIAVRVNIWFSYNWITVSEFTVTNNKVSNPFRIVLISDLHDHQFENDNEELVEKIREQSPDIIVMDGDMLNGDSENDQTVVDLIRSLIGIAPVYYSFGNHEYYYIEEGHVELQNDLEEAGAVVLNYQNIDIEVKGNPIRLGGLYEYGFETGMQSEEENQRAVSYLEKYVDTDRYIIMCAHRPESFYPWDMADTWGIDLVLSGHLHGGQVIIPGIGGLYSSLENFFPKYDFGQYKLEKSDIIITRGLSSNKKVLPRLNNPPEVAVINIEPEGSNGA